MVYSGRLTRKRPNEYAWSPVVSLQGVPYRCDLGVRSTNASRDHSGRCREARNALQGKRFAFLLAGFGAWLNGHLHGLCRSLLTLLNLLLEFAPELVIIDLRSKRFLELRVGFHRQINHGVVLVDFAGEVCL